MIAQKRSSKHSASANGKFILVGEHAVVYGAHAVAFPLKSRSTHLSTVSAPTPSENTSVDFLLEGKPAPHSLSEACSQGLELLGIGPHHLHLTGSTSIPMGAGLGSSAALCVCILKLLATQFGIDLSPTNLAVLANRLEKRFHGNPSGLDTHTIALEKPIEFSKDFGAQEIHLPEAHLEKFNLMLIDTEIRASTLAMVRVASSYFSTDSGPKKIIDRFNQLALSAVTALKSHDEWSLAEVMNEAQDHLQAAGVSSPRIEEVCQIAKRSGALAAKLTGGGGGGLVLALFPSNLSHKLETIQKEDLRDYNCFMAINKNPEQTTKG